LHNKGVLLAAVALCALAHAGGAAAQTQAPPEPAEAEAQPDSNAPIVPDSQFEAELPALDPALNGPLEPIESFDMPAFPAAPGAETVPDAPPPEDPALAQPLPPLATFDVTPPEPTTEDEAAAPSPVRYTLEVEGLDEIGLEGRFRGLSALEDGDGEATNGAMVSARAREDEALALRILRSEGYYDGTAVATVEPIPDQPAQLRATLTAVPGDRYRFGEISVVGAETVPPNLARESLGVKSGDPIVAAIVEGAEAGVALRLPQEGYPFATVGMRDIVLDPATDLGDYTLPVDPGPRARFGGYRTEGDLAFDAEHVGVLARFKRGDLYDSRRVDDLREAMVATNLFTSVSAEPVRTGQMAPDGTEYVEILVRQDAGPARSLAANAGFSTGEGFRIEGSWEHRNLFPPEGALRAAAVAGTQEQSVSLQFRRSNAGKRDRTVSVTAEAGRRDYEAFEAFTATLSGRVTRESTPIWHKKWTYGYGVELVATNEDRFNPATLDRERATYFIGAVPLQLGYDTSDNLLNPTTGFRVVGRVSPEVSLQGSARPYVRMLVDGSAYYPFGDSFVLAGRVRFGSIQGTGRDDLPPSRRYYAGGGGSVRGFGFQDIGPRDINDDPLGGRSLAEYALEGRYRFGDYGIVAFLDAGQVYESSTPGFSDLRYGFGIGGRVYTNFGPLRVDVATPLGRREGEPRVALYISIGQAF
jgi:translocation and assembly module TamA